MSRLRSYNDEFKREAVKLVKSSNKSRATIAKDLGVPMSTLHGWISGSVEDRDGKIITDSEVRRLKRELADTKLERDILKKAVGIFSKAQK